MGQVLTIIPPVPSCLFTMAMGLFIQKIYKATLVHEKRKCWIAL